MSHYMSPVEILESHVKDCPQCAGNAFGLCERGFRLLGEIAGMRKADNQLELGLTGIQDKPLVRAAMEFYARKNSR